MEELIQRATEKLGADEGAVRAATGALVRLVLDRATPVDEMALIAGLPGAQSLSDEAHVPGVGISRAIGAAPDALPPGTANRMTADLVALQGSGLEARDLPRLVAIFLDFARDRVGPELVGRILERSPELGRLIG